MSVLMKKAMLLMFLLVSWLATASGFDVGNAEYRKGNFQGAADAYESVVASGKVSVELYFNLGNAYYKLNRVAPAIYNYEKALQLDPGNATVQNNLKFAQKLQIDKVNTVPKVGFRKLIEDYTGWLSVDGWAWLAVVSAFAILGFFVGYYFSWHTVLKRIWFIAMGVGILVMLLSLFAGYFEKTTQAQKRSAIVFEQAIGVKSEPEINAPDAFLLHEGTKVDLLESLDQWRKITLPDGNQGWIPASAIKEL